MSLLKQIDVSFECINAEIDESSFRSETAVKYVQRMALEKANAGWSARERQRDIPLLAADTSVVLKDNIMGKPGDKKAAFQMLSELSGNTHQVMTSVALKQSERIEIVTSITDVQFDRLSSEMINYYIQTGDCFDKAGSYGIQGFAARFVKTISGSYSGVVGLPLFETAKLLDKFVTDRK